MRLINSKCINLLTSGEIYNGGELSLNKANNISMENPCQYYECTAVGDGLSYTMRINNPNNDYRECHIFIKFEHASYVIFTNDNILWQDVQEVEITAGCVIEYVFTSLNIQGNQTFLGGLIKYSIENAGPM